MSVFLIVTCAASALCIGAWGLMILRPASLPERIRSDRRRELDLGLWLGFTIIVASGWIGSLGQLAADHGLARWPFMATQPVVLVVGAAVGIRAARRIKRWEATQAEPEPRPTPSSSDPA